jgi:signal transduction histidine kinase
MDKQMSTPQPTVLLISHDAAVCSAVRSALQRSGPSCAISTVATFAAARHTVADLAPDVIILQESSLRTLRGAPGVRPSVFADVVAALAGFAPVVILGKEDQPASLVALVAAGAADFIPAGESHLPDAAACVAKRLHSCRRLSLASARSVDDFSCPDLTRDQHFGELLRHELSNPLTGILGNAELLLAETRWQNPPQLSEPGVKRLETIAALAVRMRETVRRLSQASESRG